MALQDALKDNSQVDTHRYLACEISDDSKKIAANAIPVTDKFHMDHSWHRVYHLKVHETKVHELKVHERKKIQGIQAKLTISQVMKLWTPKKTLHIKL